MLIAICATVCAACTERIDLSTRNAPPQLVINGYITTEAQRHTVSIAQTMPYLGAPEHRTFSDARVAIDGVLLSSEGDGVYATDPAFAGIPGQTYRLDVELDYNGDGAPEHYTAETTIPPVHTLDSITIVMDLTSHRPADDPLAMIFIHFQDIKNVINTFGAHLYINDTLYSNKFQRYFINPFGDYSADGMYIHFPTAYMLQKEMRWDDDQYKLIFSGDKFTIELNMIAPDYFEFIRIAKLEIGGGNPLFGGLPANVPSNISGGALGYFGSYTVSRVSAVLLDKYGFPKRKQGD